MTGSMLEDCLRYRITGERYRLGCEVDGTKVEQGGANRGIRMVPEERSLKLVRLTLNHQLLGQLVGIVV